MKNLFLIHTGKALSTISKLANKGAGSTWPGHIALGANKNIIKDILKNSHTEVICIVGTNGKTTTGRILMTILENAGKKVFQNNSGANLLNGIASSLLLNTNPLGKLTKNYAIFEIDENNLSLILEEVTPKAIVVLDLFRDQLDRYGELDSIANKWKESFAHLPPTTQLILNADDPLVSSLGDKTNALYFGLSERSTQKVTHAADSLYCPYCSHKLEFSTVYYSHLGDWKCPSCKHKRPELSIKESFYPLDGTYNKYNTLAAVLAAQSLGISQEQIDAGLHHVTPAFGRQEKIIVDGKNIQIFLAKNPTSFNESLKTISQLHNLPRPLGEGRGEGRQTKTQPKVMLLLNDRIPDGTDVSWIWDIDLEDYVKDFGTMYVGGDRMYDMVLRIQYAFTKPVSPLPCVYDEDLTALTKIALKDLENDETLYILPTYSAMLDIRKILTGKKIL